MSLKIRAEEQALMLWNDQSARAAWLDGRELESLIRWAAQGEENGFSRRLRNLGLLDEECRETVLKAASLAAFQTAPLRSLCAPESLHIELTERCALHCPQCYKALSQSDMALPVLSSILRQAAEMNVFQIALGGGEPLLYPDLEEAVSQITELGMACSITTSGYGLDGNKLKGLTERGVKHIQISLNGSTAEIHGKSRDGYEFGRYALELLKQSEISYGINWVARMDNIDDFPEVIKLGGRFQVHNINILRYKPSHGERYCELRLTKDKLDFLCHVIRSNKEIPLKVDSSFSGLLCHLNGYAGSFTGCGAGRRFLAVDVKGYFKPCSHIQMREKGEDLRHIWYDSKNLAMFRRLEEQIGEPCKTCKYLSGCRGCRAITAAGNKDFYAGEPGCCMLP